MLTQEEFENQIEARTGKKLGEHYGFIAGTEYPFIGKGMQSANLKPGFKVWEKTKDGVSRYLEMFSGPNTLEIICTWLDDNLTEEKKQEELCRLLGGVSIIMAE